MIGPRFSSLLRTVDSTELVHDLQFYSFPRFFDLVAIKLCRTSYKMIQGIYFAQIHKEFIQFDCSAAAAAEEVHFLFPRLPSISSNPIVNSTLIPLEKECPEWHNKIYPVQVATLSLNLSTINHRKKHDNLHSPSLSTVAAADRNSSPLLVFNLFTWESYILLAIHLLLLICTIAWNSSVTQPPTTRGSSDVEWMDQLLFTLISGVRCSLTRLN